MLAEKRYYARHNCQAQADFICAGMAIRLAVINVSNGGVGFEISHEQKLTLLKAGFDLQIGCDLTLDISSLPLSAGVGAQGLLIMKLRHLRRLSQQQYIAGAEFIDLSEDQRRLLERLCPE